MKKTILSIFLLVTYFGFSQTTDLGKPLSWSNDLNTPVTKITVKTINLEKVMAEDLINDKATAKPYRIGIAKDINLGFESGTWTELSNKDRLWRLNISSKDALHLSVNFDNFYIPEGASLYLYNNSKTDLLGAYTSLNNNESNRLGSWFVEGDNLWIEYFEPFEVKGQGKIHLDKIIHGYRLGKKHQSSAAQRALNDSGSCNQDVDCPVGADFDSIKDEVKHSVAFLNMGNGYICSGGLINNANNDKTPYFLTANHCYSNGDNFANYSMRFNWITSGTPQCATYNNTASGPTNFVMYGATLKAKSENSDFMLVELNNNIPSSWDIRYAGWDKSDTTPSFQVGIHHPSGDIMKVCRDNEPALKTTTGGVPIWVIKGTSFGSGNGWDIGVTEGGSSGSPLFDQTGKVIGQLWAGGAECTGLDDNDDIDYYGRLSRSWTGDGTDSSRLSTWLDPNNTGITSVNTLNNTASINHSYLEEHLSIYPNPTNGIITIKLVDINLSSNLTYEITSILGQKVQSNTIDNLSTEINLSSLTNNIYFLKITDHNNNSYVKKIVLNK